MKFLKPQLLLAVLFMVFTACSNDDDNGPTMLELTNANLAGTYELTFVEGTEVETDGSTGVEVETVEYVGTLFQDVNFVFTENGTFMTSGSFVLNTTTTTGNNAPEEEDEIINLDEEIAGYTINESADTLVIDGESYTVTRFTSTELRLEYEDTYEEDGNTITVSEEWRFTRQN